jgi:hypothetical protein
MTSPTPLASGLSILTSMPGSASPTLPGISRLPGRATVSTGDASVRP